jgi:hypothetical protein
MKIHSMWAATILLMTAALLNIETVEGMARGPVLFPDFGSGRDIPYEQAYSFLLFCDNLQGLMRGYRDLTKANLGLARLIKPDEKTHSK